MEAPDGGKVKVLLPPVCLVCSYPGVRLMYFSLQPPQPHDVTATFVEIVGTVVDASTIKLLTCIDMGSKLGGSHIFRRGIIDLQCPSRLGYGEPGHRADIRSRVQGQNLLISVTISSPQTLPKRFICTA